MNNLLNFLKSVSSSCDSFCANIENKNYISSWVLNKNPYDLYLKLSPEQRSQLNMNDERFLEACLAVSKINKYIFDENVMFCIARNMNCPHGPVFASWREQCKKNIFLFLSSPYYNGIVKWADGFVNINDLKEEIKKGETPSFPNLPNVRVQKHHSSHHQPRSVIQINPIQNGISIKNTKNHTSIPNTSNDRVRSLEELEKLFGK